MRCEAQKTKSVQHGSLMSCKITRTNCQGRPYPQAHSFILTCAHELVRLGAHADARDLRGVADEVAQVGVVVQRMVPQRRG